tara:strand:- start:1346 stop:2074 length:729 start_codon:yes stop_codon:yes gene_type:complete
MNNQLNSLASPAEITMTSIEMVKYLNDERRNYSYGYAEVVYGNFMTRVPKVLGETQASKFLETKTYTNGLGHEVPRNIYRFPKREACLMAMSYSYELQAKVFDKMTALEAKLPKFPIPTTLVEALRLALESAEKLEVAMVQVESMKPAVEFVERFTGTPETQTLSDVAKTIGIRVSILTAALIEDRVVFRKGGKGTVYPHASHVINGRFIVKQFCPDGISYSYTSMAVTPKGAVWLTQQYGN